MSGTRVEQKERTRRAIVDAALTLLEDSSLVALSLRQVAKEVGIVPTAFYRHFDSIDALGLDLVDESFASLREMLREVRQGAPDVGSVITNSVEVLCTHVSRQHAHYAFIARERVAGPDSVRAAIAHQLELVTRDLAIDLARLPAASAWTTEDLNSIADLIVNIMVATASALIKAERPDDEAAVAARARRQLQLLVVGLAHWRRPSS